MLLERQAEAGQLLRLVARENAFVEWLEFFLSAVAEACAWSSELLDSLFEHRTAGLARVGGERTAERLADTIDFALARPYFNVGQLAAALPDGNFKSAARVVERLENLGLVEETTGQARHRVFRLRAWSEALEALSQRTAAHHRSA